MIYNVRVVTVWAGPWSPLGPRCPRVAFLNSQQPALLLTDWTLRSTNVNGQSPH